MPAPLRSAQLLLRANGRALGFRLPPAGFPQQCSCLPWERQPLALGCPDNTGQKGRTTMFMNRLTLIGFLGQDAEQKFTRDGNAYTILSIATKRSWKDDAGEWQSRTEWHRSVVY